MTTAMKSSSIYEHRESRGGFPQYNGSGFSSADKDHKQYTYEKKTIHTFGNGIHNKTDEYDYIPKPLDLSLNDFKNLGNLLQRIRKHRINPQNSSLSPQFVFVTNQRNDFGINKMERFQSYLDLQHYLPITFDPSEDDRENQFFMDALVRSLIEVYPNSLIQFRLKKSENAFNGLYFTANVEVSNKIVEFLKEECYLPEKEANSAVWKLNTTKDLVSWNSSINQFAKSEIYFSYNEKEYQSKSLNNVFEYIETKEFSEHSEYSRERVSESSFKWSTNTVKSFNSKFNITTYTNEDKQMEIIHVIKITVQVSAEDREMIIKCLKLNVLESDAVEICSVQESDGPLPIHDIIFEHLKIKSIEEAIKGLTFFVGGFEELKNYPSSVWQTAFVMKYLERVLEDQRMEWEEAYEKADRWISEFLQYNDQHKGLLHAASEEYLIQQGIIVHNELSKVITVSFEVDHNTNKTICGMLGSTANNNDGFDEIINSQTNSGNFKCNDLISGSFRIKLLDENINSLKNYAEKLCLRRLDNSVWTTSLIIVYFEIVLAKYRSESKWSSAYERAKALVQQRVRNPNYERELHDACEKFLLRQGYNFMTKKYQLIDE